MNYSLYIEFHQFTFYLTGTGRVYLFVPLLFYELQK